MSTGVSPRERDVPLFHLYLDSDRRILRVAWQGEVTLDGIRQGFSRIRTFASDLQLIGAISDFTETVSFRISSADIHALSQEPPVFRNGVPRITVGGADYIFGMARMYELINEDHREGIYVVRTLKEAYKILKVEDPIFEKVDLP